MTPAALLALWAARDSRYGLRKHGLTEAEYQAARRWRLAELSEVQGERARLAVALAVWDPRR